MRIVVIGGFGAIGSQLVAELCDRGHEAVRASPDTLTGAGLASALAGAAVVVDVSSQDSLERADRSARNLLAAEAAAGVGHHVALSALSTEPLIAQSSIPYSIVRVSGADDAVARALARIAVGPPLNGVAGPDQS
jgi:uncharacterized protein YbjT (DUF2867 family)